MILLRPWFLLLILVPFIFKGLLNKTQSNSAWKDIIDPKLLPALLIKGGANSITHMWSPLLILIWTLFVIAISGPAIKHAPIPASSDLENTVVVLDLGPTMTPQMLNIAHTKLYDLLDVAKNNRIGLVLYTDKGYTAIPLTADKAMIKNMIPSLNPSVLPNTHNKPSVGFLQADQLIQQTGGSGRILYITVGGVNVQNVSSRNPIGVLALGKDEDISPALKSLGTFQKRTVDSTDLTALLNATRPTSAHVFQTTDMADYAFDLGGVICLCLLPLFAWTFRKGWLFIFLLLFYTQAQAAFLKRADQLLYETEKDAVAAYNNQNYEAALSGFAHNPYNQGNTLAHMGKIPEAIESYKLALQLNPHDADAKFNKEYLEKLLQNQQQQNDQNQQQDQQESQSENNQQSDETKDDADNSSQQNTPDQSQSDPNENKDSETPQSAQQESEEQNDPSESPQERPEQSDETQEQQNQPVPLDNAQEQMPFNQQDQQILNRLNKDPSQVLRYRIYKQHIRGN